MFKNLSQQKRQLFERVILPHLDAAFNLARWLVSNNNDAQDITQEAYMKAFRLFDNYQDQDARAWILTIVRNTSYSWLKKHKMGNARLVQNLSEEGWDTVYTDMSTVEEFSDLSDWLVKEADLSLMYQAIERLPLNFKEIIVLREIEGCNYKEISDILAIPAGTVMSRLSRARLLLQELLVKERVSARSEEERR